MATTRKGTYESQIGLLTEQRSRQNKDGLCFFGPPQTFNSMGTPSLSTDAIIIPDEDEEVTLKPKNKRLGSWWDNVDEYDELSCVYKGQPKPNDDSDVLSSFDLLQSSHAIINIEDDKKETLEPMKKKPRLGSLYDDSCVVKGSLKAKDNYAASRVDSCFPSTHSREKKKDERSVSSHDNVIDLCDEDESISSNNEGYGHVTLEDLGVSVDYLKSIPWEAFDPTWEIRSVAMDPWLGGYVEDLLFPC